MDQAFLIYLLSISTNVAHTAHNTGTFAVVLAVVLYLAVWIGYDISLEDTKGEERTRRTELFKDREPIVRKYSLGFLITAAVCWFFSTLFPSTEAVLRAYALIEGSKVINAENAEKAAEAVGKRFDRFLDIVDKGVNGRSSRTEEKSEPAQSGGTDGG